MFDGVRRVEIAVLMLTRLRERTGNVPLRRSPSKVTPGRAATAARTGRGRPHPPARRIEADMRLVRLRIPEDAVVDEVPRLEVANAIVS